MTLRTDRVAGLALVVTVATAVAGPIDTDHLIEIPMLDFAALELEDADRERAGMPPRYAVPHSVFLTPRNSGTWTPTAEGMLEWTIGVTSPAAASINLGFERWHVPASVEMTVGSLDGHFTIRPFTSDDNADHGQLWTPPVPGESALISMIVAPEDRAVVEEHVALTSINVGYRGFYDMADVARSGSCNYDVHCAETEGWEHEISCVAVISTGGSTFCTGFMVNNTRNDRTPFFMTANHCGINSGNAASLVTFWNYENDPPVNCPGAGGETGTLDQFNTGSTLRAEYDPSDVTLVELDAQPEQDWEISYCGWNANDAATDWSVAIHHPATDAKRWSIDYDPSEIYGYNGPGDTHIRIIDWDLGTTEPGSSGSPLFDPDHRVVGQLHGGYAACGNDLEDWYGRFAVSWNNGLSQHLDPDNTGALVCDTLPGTGLSVTPTTPALYHCTSGCTNPNISTSTYTITNNAPEAMGWTASFGIGHYLQFDTPSSGTLNPGQSTTLQISLITSVIESLNDGIYEDALNIIDIHGTSGFQIHQTLEIGTTLTETNPTHHFYAGGPVGGPFNATQTYTVTSHRPTPTEMAIEHDAPWISATPASFTLYGVGDSVDVQVGFTDAANDLPAGLVSHTLTFKDLTTPSHDHETRDVTLDVGRFSYTAYDTPIPINDNEEFTSTIEVSDGYCIGDLDVEMDISHTYIGDLEVDLTSPTGVTVRLHDRTGGSSDDIVVTYDDDGGTLPDGPGELADFNGELVAGTWTLWVRDNAGADTGALNSWTLKIASTGELCPPSAEDIDTATDTDTPVDITLIGQSVEGGSLDFVITGLPDSGDLSDPGGGTIYNTPHTLTNGGDVVTYSPDTGFYGADTFTYRTDDGLQSDEALVTITVGAIPNPDDCHQAFDLPNGQWDFSTLDATTDGEQHDECQFDGQTYNDIWYRYTACGDGDLTVSTCNMADYDTDLVLYDATCGGTLLACNDDTSGCETYTSMVTVPVTEGDVVIVRVGGWNDDDLGTGTLLIDGPDDDCGEEPCDGDMNGDGSVDVNDILHVIAGYGDEYGVDDILFVLENFGSDC